MVRALKAQGKPVRAVKPIISGWDDDPAAVAASDTGILLAAQGLDLSPENIEACSPYRFKAPLSPDMAAGPSTSNAWSAIAATSRRAWGITARF